LGDWPDYFDSEDLVEGATALDNAVDAVRDVFDRAVAAARAVLDARGAAFVERGDFQPNQDPGAFEPRDEYGGDSARSNEVALQVIALFGWAPSTPPSSGAACSRRGLEPGRTRDPGKAAMPIIRNVVLAVILVVGPLSACGGW